MSSIQQVQTSLRLVATHCIGSSLPHVLHRIDEFLTPFISHDVFTKACEEGVSESTLEFLLHRVAPIWHEAVSAAVRGGHLNILQWMTGIKYGRRPWKSDFDNLPTDDIWDPEFNNVLEIAAAYGHLEIIKWLWERGQERCTISETVSEFPQNFGLHTYCLSTALEYAAEFGDLEVVQWIYNTRSEKCRLKRSPIDEAIANGNLAIAQFFHNNGETCYTGATTSAALNGNLDILQWLQSIGQLQCKEHTMEEAAKQGQLDVVKWLHETGIATCPPDALYRVACSGHFEVAEWLIENVDVDFSLTRGYYVRKIGNFKLLRWIANHFSGIDYRYAIREAAGNGDLEILKWLHECQKVECTRESLLVSVRNGHLNVIKWLHSYYPGIYHEERVLDVAAEYGHLNIVRWLHENKVGECSTDAMDEAARNGHLEVVLYLLENRNEGFSSDSMTCPMEFEVKCVFSINSSDNTNQTKLVQLNMLQNIFKTRSSFVRGGLRCLAEIAAREGLIEILDWVKQFGLELRSSVPIRLATSRGDVKLLLWFYQNGFDVSDPELLEVTIENNKLDAAHWLLNHGHTIKHIDLEHINDNKENVPMLRWLVEHGPPIALPVAMKQVVEFGYVEISSLLSEDVRVQIVLEVLQTDKREVLWWILTQTQFECHSSYQSIHDGVQRASNKTMLWFKEKLSDSTIYN